MDGSQEKFVVVTAPAGVVFVSALPADFQVVNLNTMYFSAGGHYYVPYLSSDGKELYVMVDTPPQPAVQAAQPAVQPTAAAPAAQQAAPAVRAVADTLVVPADTLLLVRVASTLSSDTAKPGDRFQGFLDIDLAANGRFVTPHGSRVYGVVTAVEHGDKTRGKPSLSVALGNLQIGDRVVSIQTFPVKVTGQAGHGGQKLVEGVAMGAKIGHVIDDGGGVGEGAAAGAVVGVAGAAASSPDPAVIPAQSQLAFTVGAPVQVELTTNVAVR
jgi:hypothetical protein